MAFGDFLKNIPIPGRNNDAYLSLSQDDGLPAPVTTAPTTSNSFRSTFNSLNPFKRPGEISLDNEQVVTSDPGMFELSRWDRMLIFAITFAGSLSCYLVCIFLFPILTLKPRKFAILWSLGSLLFIISFGVLQGPATYFKHLFSSERLLFTLTFFSSIVLTLVFSLGLKSTILSILAAIVQLVAMVWYTVSYFPLGTQSLQLASGVARSQIEGWINS